MDRHMQDQTPLLAELRQRLIHIEDKVERVLAGTTTTGEFRGARDQRYGHLTFSQHGEDLVFVALLERFGIEKPTYLDIGANHPLDCSNTALLFRRGAHGVNIDASPDVVRLFEVARPNDVNVNVGVGGSPGELVFYRIDPTSGRNTFSRAAIDQFLLEAPNFSVTDEIKVPVLTLDQVIDTYCGGVCPDLLSIDAEGMDLDILKAASFATRPRILCVETFSSLGESGAEIDALLVERGFRKCLQMFANGIYVNQDAAI